MTDRPAQEQESNVRGAHAGSSNGTSQLEGAEPSARGDASAYSRDAYGNGAKAGSGRGSGGRSKAKGKHAGSTEQAASKPAGGDGGSHRLTVDDVYPEIARVRKRNHRIKRVGAMVACVLVAILAAGGAYAWWFVSSLDKALSPDDETSQALGDVLVSQIDGEPFYMLIMGSDSREGNSADHVAEGGNNERSDVIMLARIDTEKKKVTLLSIPRDTAFGLKDGSYVKINEVYNRLGPAGEVQAVSKVTGASISHHAEVRISGLENIVDLLGGVTVDVPVDLTGTTTDRKEISIKAGKQKLNGQEAQIFARARHEYETDQDQQRQSSVRQLLQAIIDEILDRPVTELPGLILQLAEYVDTDLKTGDALSLAMAFSGGGMTMYSSTGPWNGAINEQAGDKWLCFLNEPGWQAVMDVVDSGKNPKDADLDYAATEIPWEEVEGQPEFLDSFAYQYYYGNPSRDMM